MPLSPFITYLYSYQTGPIILRERGVSYYESVKKSGWQGKLEFFEEKDEGHVYQLFNVEGENTKKFIKRLVSFLQLS